MKIVKSLVPPSPYNAILKDAAECIDENAFDTFEMATVLYKFVNTGKPFEEGENPHDPGNPAFVSVDQLMGFEDACVKSLVEVTLDADRALDIMRAYWKTTDERGDLVVTPEAPPIPPDDLMP